ncbi:MAG: Cof-type HAD-IIB family hydrolase [Armatimonadota bacterium]|nr:Cof-type HAD-IIB family hydrolase [Armatimonadota bacterium]MDR7451970.1 Cof-type HAD-IIB family hydrolase [Armatimonadota bacterium]MDR7468363.1 Cof-type HAD-IIB family hydrolase [Armatimonadota bacterium]MDR7494286.1 Cof-type HAD-IIB family hydrolase [Armatimonadota bacterium]MDR7500552.1 Cof-type HAD-IIB family hydrolase [Armatimonadota bacterium]
MGFRLLVADIDGTLVTGDRRITPKVRAAVRGAQEAGVRVCLATGRMWRSAEPYVLALGADPPAILYNGGLVYDFRTGTEWRRLHLEQAHARAVLEILRHFPEVQPHLYVGDQVYTGRMNEITERYQRKDGLQVTAVGDLLAFLPPDPMKILIIGPRPSLEQVARAVAALPAAINTVFSEDTYLEILPTGSSKGDALRFVAARLGVPLAETIAVGDNLNDLEMIRIAGVGVAMGNAPAELKAHAGYIAPSNDEEGLADVIDRFVLGGEHGATSREVHR